MDYKKVLPDIPSIQGKSEYFNSSVLVLIANIKGKDYFVFQKRSMNIRQGGEICFPGGRIEQKDLNVMETAIRETEEELGISKSQIYILGQMNTVVAPMGATVDAFLGYIDEKTFQEIKVNEDEVEEVIILPVLDFKDPKKYSVRIEIQPTKVNPKTKEEVVLFPAEELGLSEKYTKPWGGFEYNVFVYETHRGVIWGITARLIYEVVSKLR
ncbi:MAG: NUDIX hydrolase [Cellulosilyticaceae bacterium]